MEKNPARNRFARPHYAIAVCWLFVIAALLTSYTIVPQPTVAATNHHHHGTLLQYGYYPKQIEDEEIALAWLSNETLRSRQQYCYNSHRWCEQWARAGECAARALYMRENCRAACGECDLNGAKMHRLGIDSSDL